MTNNRFDVNEMPALDCEVAAHGSYKEQPVAVGQIVAGIVIGVVIAVRD